MTLLSKISRASGLDRVPVAKRALKQAFYWVQDPLGRGLPLAVGGRVVRVPARFARPPWTNFEPAATRRVAAWAGPRPNAIVIDVGCSIALYSLLALWVSPRSEVWAIDADPVSLQATRWLCRHAGLARLHVIHGYAADRPTETSTAHQAALMTVARLATDRVTADPAQTRYTCLDSQAENAIPVHRLDRLFVAGPDRPWLLKIDVEGAELLVLRGAEHLLATARPQLLVSVHPPLLHRYGFTSADVRAWLEMRDYHIEIDVDAHEEHWWCTPAA